MANEITTKKPTMSMALASNGIKELGANLSLTSEQINRAKSTALALSSDPKLSKCDPFSLIKYCFETARYNFTRDDCIYPVPYGDKVQAQMGYKGFRELCLRGGYKEITSVPVYECDKVYRDRETGQIKVDFNEDYLSTMGSKIIGYYAYAIDKGETTPCNTLFWDIDKIVKHGKHYSKSYNSIWGDNFNFDKMARKTLIKQLCSELRTTPEIQSAVKLDQIVFGKENEKDGYLDNPFYKEEETKTTVKNSIAEVEEPKEEEDDILEIDFPIEEK